VSEPRAPATVPGLADSAEGEVRPLRSADLAFPVAGVLAERLVAVGDAVDEGDALLRLDDETERARLREADAALAAADAQVEVARTAQASAREQVRAAQASLASAQAARDAAAAALDLTATQAEATIAQARANLRQAEAGVAQATAVVDQARAAVAQAEAELARAQAQRAQAEAARASAALAVERRTLRAPFDGRVLAVGPEPGETVAGGSDGRSLVTLADVSGWRVDTTNLTELQVVAVDVGDRVTIEVDALPDRAFAGTVERIGFDPRQVRGDVTYVAEVRIDPGEAAASDLAELRPGMTAVVRGLLNPE
jgi:multidrug resistance efflux pump